MKPTTLTILISLLLFQYTTAQEYKPSYFQKKELIEDLSFMMAKIETMHPILLDEAFDVKWYKSGLKIEEELPDSMSINQFYVQMAELLGELEDTHTGISFPYSERKKYMIDGGGVSMPFSISVKDHRLYVNEYFAEDRSLDIAGKQILVINNITSDQILQDMRNTVGVRGRECGDRSVEKMFAMSFWALYGETNVYRLKLMGEDTPLVINGVSNAKYFELKKKYGSQQNPEKYHLAFSEDQQLAKMSIASFYGDEQYYQFLKDAFQEIKSKGSKQLIIDVRNNPGGRSRAVDSLLNYLTDKSYSQYKSIGIRVSEELKANYKQKRPELYARIEKLPNDTLFYMDSTAYTYKPNYKESAFTGEVYFLINERSNSAAATFAGVVKEKGLGTIVGNKATGENIRYYGDFLMYKLPNTKITFYVSPKEFIQYGGTNLNQGVQPDVLIRDFEFRDEIN
ncbi:S41 family peptidase [Marinifilum flexuosum]|uniref:S41 family peptidase n=1 Tax=Marinifilum flexuosum TaxID=1117708 RepID=UPI00249594B0|nr:S41 family peptidase [Marinifilum flexuosum]